jgi:poly-gamma-glutamate capsule biosynthesis protein CapA/YwtB (metallophosphatase superfamily)
MLGSNLDTTWAIAAAARLGRPVPALPDPHVLLGSLSTLVADADVVLLNSEGAVGEGTVPPKCRPGSRNCYAFRQQPEAGRAWKWLGAGAIIANLANNHALDAGAAGLAATVDHFRRAGVFVTGVDTLATAAIVGAADTVGVLGFSAAQAGPDARDPDAVARHVSRAKALYPRLIVTVHMGAEGAGAQRTFDTTEIFLGENRGNPVRFARVAAQAGASLIVGHGPHVLRGGEWVGGTLVAYSLGNLLTYGPFSFGPPRDRSGVLCADLDDGGAIVSAEFRSTMQVPPGLVRADPAGIGAGLLDSLSRLDFPETGLRVAAEGRISIPER